MVEIIKPDIPEPAPEQPAVPGGSGIHGKPQPNNDNHQEPPVVNDFKDTVVRSKDALFKNSKIDNLLVIENAVNHGDQPIAIQEKHYNRLLENINIIEKTYNAEVIIEKYPLIVIKVDQNNLYHGRDMENESNKFSEALDRKFYIEADIVNQRFRYNENYDGVNSNLSDKKLHFYKKKDNSNDFFIDFHYQIRSEILNTEKKLKEESIRIFNNSVRQIDYLSKEATHRFENGV